jgi:hypothetical protein
MFGGHTVKPRSSRACEAPDSRLYWLTNGAASVKTRLIGKLIAPWLSGEELPVPVARAGYGVKLFFHHAETVHLRLPVSFAAALCIALTAHAGTEEPGIDDIVRLPGNGLIKAGELSRLDGTARLVPGGGLIASFDSDEDGYVSAEELTQGIRAAFAAADANEDGRLTALEQQAWAESLPTRDDTLANPVRFDPNLDRIVTFEEFDMVIRQMAAPFQDEQGRVPISRLKAPEPRPERPSRNPLSASPARSSDTQR